LNKRHRRHIFLRWLGRGLLGLLLFLILLLLFIRSPWGQDIIVGRLVTFISGKTGTEVNVDKLFIGFSGDLVLEGLYMEDRKGDTLLYSKKLEARLGIAPLLLRNELNLGAVLWKGVRAHIIRPDSAGYNFNFLLQAFSSRASSTQKSNSNAFAFHLGTASLSDFRVRYADSVSGMKADIHLGKLELQARETNLHASEFDLRDIKLSHSDITILQWGNAIKADSAAGPLPRLRISEWTMEDVGLRYQSIPDSLLADLRIGQFTGRLPEADLAEKRIRINGLNLRNSSLTLKQGKRKARASDSIFHPSNPQPFIWPPYDLEVNSLVLENNGLRLQLGPASDKSGFNPRDFQLSSLSLKETDFTYHPENASLQLNGLSFEEAGGLALQNLSANARLHPSGASLSDIVIRTGSSELTGNAVLDYNSFQAFLEAPGEARVKIQIPKARLNMQDAFHLNPRLARNEYLVNAAGKPLLISIEANGNMDSLQLKDARLAWGQNTSLSTQGSLRHVSAPDSLAFAVENFRFKTTKEDILSFVPQDDVGVNLPNSLRIKGHVAGKPKDLKGRFTFTSPLGNMRFSGSYKQQKALRISGKVVAENLRLDSLLQNNRLGPTSLSADFSLAGQDMEALDAGVDARFTRLEAAGYDFSGLTLHGQMTGGRGNVRLKFKDENLDLLANTLIRLDKEQPKADLDLRLNGADLQALGLTREDIRLALELKANYSGTANDYSVSGRVQNAVAVYENRQYHPGELSLKADMDTVRTDIRITGDFLTGELHSNTSVPGMRKAIRERIKNYFSTPADTVSRTDAVQVALTFKIMATPVLTKVFLPKVERLDSVLIKADYNGAAGTLQGELKLPTAIYNGSTIDSLHVLVNGTHTQLGFSAGFRNLIAGPLHIRHTALTGDLRDQNLLLNLQSTHEGKVVMHIASDITISGDTLRLHVDPSNLLLNYRPWTLPKDNRVTIADSLLRFEHVHLQRNGQQLVLGNGFPGVDTEHFGLRFKDFRLQTFVSLLNPGEPLISGAVNGKLVVENPFLSPGMLADFSIDDLKYMGHPLGSLTFKGTSDNNARYGFDMGLQGEGADLALKGEYQASKTAAELDLNLDIRRLDFHTIQAFSNGALEDSEGTITGNMEVSGTTAAPEYNGHLNFRNAGFRVASLNSAFMISHETLDLDTDGIYFHDFDISDTQGSSLTLNGTILTEDFLNPGFDLTIKAEDFRVLNSTEKDNDLFYGNARLGMDINLRGDLQLPRAEGRLRVGEDSEITYVVPETRQEVEERDGVVIFVNHDNPDDILTRNEQKKVSLLPTGMDLHAVLEIARDAKLYVIIDRRFGDNLMVSGKGALNLNITPNGQTQLTGRYELQSGHYETSLYNLVNRRFEIQSGSSITWQGDPMDAKLDVTAVYAVKTSAGPLMAPVTSGQEANIAMQYQQVLPFLVYLNVDGQLLQPKISFDLGMPEDEQGVLGGAVYSRVQQLNQQEAELNKEVFSLLALNRFYPARGSDGSTGGTALIARDNVNKVLSGQLNAFSDQVFGKSGFDLDFNLDTFTDYQGETPQERTQLNINARKKLFNNRLIVTAGSAVDVEGSAQPGQKEIPIIGNVSLEYLLTENGRYRLRGFRKSEYENIIEGQQIVTGLALIFNREFNEFSELFNPLKKEKEKQ